MVMMPAFSLLLAFNLTSAMRVLFTIAIVLVSLSRRDVRETGAESVLSAMLAGAVAVAFSVLYAFWPSPAPRCWRWHSSASWWFLEPSTAGTRGPSRWRSPWSGCYSALRREARCRRRSIGASIRSLACSTRSGRARLSWRYWAGVAVQILARELRFDKAWRVRSSVRATELDTGSFLSIDKRRRVFSRHRGGSLRAGCELADDPPDQDSEIECAERCFERSADLRN